MLEAAGRDAGAIAGLDHVAVVSDRAEALFAAYEHMGFRLTPLSRHEGAPAPGKAVVPWGTGNRCAMFNAGYLELLAILDPTRHCGPFPALVSVYEGMHIVSFAASDAEAAAARLRSAGVGVAGVVRLERGVEDETGAAARARFRLVRFAEGALPEARFNVVEHRTPELLWQERYLEHPNGAVAIDEVLIAVADLDAAEARYCRVLGVAAERRGAVRRFRLPRGTFSLVAAEALATVIPGAAAPVVPCVAAVSFAVRDVARTRDVLAAGGVAATADAGRLIVAARDGCGATCLFSEAGR